MLLIYPSLSGQSLSVPVLVGGSRQNSQAMPKLARTPPNIRERGKKTIRGLFTFRSRYSYFATIAFMVPLHPCLPPLMVPVSSSFLNFKSNLLHAENSLAGLLSMWETVALWYTGRIGQELARDIRVLATNNGWFHA